MSNGYLLAARADLAAAHEISTGFGLDVIDAATVTDARVLGDALAAAANVGILLSSQAGADANYVALLRLLSGRLPGPQLILIDRGAHTPFAFLPAHWPAMPFDEARDRAGRRRPAETPPPAAPGPLDDLIRAVREKEPVPPPAPAPPASTPPPAPQQPAQSLDDFLQSVAKPDPIRPSAPAPQASAPEPEPAPEPQPSAPAESIEDFMRRVAKPDPAPPQPEADDAHFENSAPADEATPPAPTDNGALDIPSYMRGGDSPAAEAAPAPAESMAPAPSVEAGSPPEPEMSAAAPEAPEPRSHAMIRRKVEAEPAPDDLAAEAPPEPVPAPAPEAAAPEPAQDSPHEAAEFEPIAPQGDAVARRQARGAPPRPSAPADATAFAPKKLRRATPELVRVVIHQPSQLKAVIKTAKQIDPNARPAPQGISIGDIALGAHVGIALETHGAACEGAVQRRAWMGEPIDFAFPVEAADDAKQAVFLARVFVDDAQIGVIAFTRPITGAAKESKPGEVRLKRHKRVFLSYSSVDRETVSAIATAYQMAGVTHFWDRTGLKSGEEWSPRLKREIEKADLFHLCWSKAAAQSEWVAKEAEHALRRRKSAKRPEITVQMLDGPPWAPHPPTLDSINFDDFVRAAIVGYARGEA
ncbi:MAG: TIR domain-containing protein [Terricaulis sp.]|nr:TIR domain-containing protein [Terricaulis sp.]